MADDGKDKTKEPRPSGRVRHDSGGRAVWQWAIDSGKHAVDSTSRLLKKLDISHLRILEDDEREAVKRAAELGEQVGNTPAQPIGGPAQVGEDAARRSFNPYDSRTPVGRGISPPKPKPPPKPRITQPVRAVQARPGLLARLFGSGKK